MRISLRAYSLLATGLLIAVSATGCQTCSDCRGFHVRERIRSGMSRLHLPRLGMPSFLSRSDRSDHDSFQPIEPMAVPYESVPSDAIILPAPGPTTLNPPARLPESSLPPAVPSFDEDALPSANAPRRFDTLRPISHEVEVIGTEAQAGNDNDFVQPVVHELFGGSCSTCNTCETGCGKVSLFDKLRNALRGGMKWGKHKSCNTCPSPCDPCFTCDEVIMEGVVIGEYPCGPCFAPTTTWTQPSYYPQAPVYSQPPMQGYPQYPAPGQPPCSQCQQNRQQATWQANPYQQPQQQWRPNFPQQQQVPQQAYSPYPQQQHQLPYGYAQPQQAPVYQTPNGPTPVPGVQPPAPVSPQPTPVTYQPGYSPVQPRYTR